MKRLILIFLIFLVASAHSSAQVYNMGNLGTINNACGGLFYDSGGPTGTYGNNENFTATFCAPPGEFLTFSFLSLDLEPSFDFLDVYDGPNTASPLIGSFTGSLTGTITSSQGGCITFNFTSDGSIAFGGWQASITCSATPPENNNGDVCPNAVAFCTSDVYTFSNNVDQPSLGQINCLLTSPNPVWYYMQIDNPGDLDIDIEQFDIFGFPIDVDFNLWGPFSDVTDGCNQILAGTAPNVDCSYSGSAFEQASITNAQTGEIYILLLTNFENFPGFITFSSSSGSTATTNCDILCTINSLTAIPSNCDETTNTYNVEGQITLTNPPASGSLTISSNCGATTTFTAPFPPVLNYTLIGLPSNGNTCSVTASFSEDPSCSITEVYIAPPSCAFLTLNCPDYSNSSSSPTTACSNQTYYLEVENTACNGLITFTVEGNFGTFFPEEFVCVVTSVQTGGAVFVGDIFSAGNPFSITVGGINPSVFGNIFQIEVFNIFGFDFGFNGSISVTQSGNTIVGPILASGTSSIFGANISISPATITVTTPSGPLVQTVEFCRDFRIPISIDNTNFCNTINLDIPWEITCNTNGNVLSSGTDNITVYPSLPAQSNDVVLINFDEATCQWEVSPNNDCDQLDIGNIFTISPDPASVTSTQCAGGTQDFDVEYLGISGGPNCCATGGPVVPIEQSQTFNDNDIVPAPDPFVGLSNNAALLQIPANGVGGNATSFNLQFDLSGFCFNPPGFSDLDFWVTVVVDGNIISDVLIPAGQTTYTVSFGLSDIPGGFTSSSIIQIYVYPNAFSAAGVNTVFDPNVNCGALYDGAWNADFSTTLQVNYSEFEPTAGTCDFETTGTFTCCTPTSITDVQESICSGQSFNIQSWIDAVNAANPCAVFSSVPPVAAVTLPDNVLPDGINPTSVSISQIVSAYAYCDVNGNGAVGIGDTYTLISTYTLNISAQPNAGTSATLSVCDGAAAVDLITRLTGSPQLGGVWTGPSSLANGDLGTYTPGTSIAGVYTYTISGTPPCLDATATVEVIQSQSTQASIVYPGAPFCIDNSTPQSPQISGAAGGSFSVSPAGLTLNSSNGTFTPSLTSPGTYLITYSVPPVGTCPGSTAETYVVVTDIPANPTISPNPICEGVSTLVSASNGSLFEFILNGVSQGFPSNTNTFNFSNPVSGDVICVRSYPPPPFTFDGSITENEWSTPLSVSNDNLGSGFGPANNLDAIYLQNGGEYLYGALAGQTENNSNNRFLLFIDCLPGGFNNLGGWTNRTNSPYVSVENLNEFITFDPGFAPDFILCMNQANGEAFFDLYDMQNNINYYLGSDITGNLISSDLLGYQANGGSGNIAQGFEFAIPLSLLGNPSGTISTFTMLVNDPGLGNSAATFISNQFLTPAGDFQANYGDGFIDFGAAEPNPIDFTLGADCYSESCITVTSAVTPVTSFTYPTEVCEDDPDINPSLVSGFTSGGTYSSTTGLVIDENTGQIDISASTPDTYTITYTVPAIGCNPPASTDFIVTILPTPTTTPIYHE